MSKDAIVRAGEVQAPLSCGEPSGSGQAIGASPTVSAMCTMRLAAEVSSWPGRDNWVPSMAKVATTSWLGSRTLLPADAVNSGEATNASSTGFMAVLLAR